MITFGIVAGCDWDKWVKIQLSNNNNNNYSDLGVLMITASSLVVGYLAQGYSVATIKQVTGGVPLETVLFYIP
jgi:hypothetical protein